MVGNSWKSGAMTRRILLLLLVLIAASLACALPGAAPTPTSVPTPVPATTQDAEQFQQQLATASSQFAETGNLSITFTEQQLTSYLVEALAQQPDLKVIDPQILLQDGQLQILGKTLIGKLTLGFQINFQPKVEDGKLKLDVASARVGKVPIPDKLLAQITDLVNQNLNENLTVEGRQVQIETVDIAAGKLTVTGKAR